MTFVLATANQGKIKEMRKILTDLGYDLKTRKDLDIDVDIEETSDTFSGNALLKARAICDISGFPAIADDSGLCVNALEGAPGVYSSSFGGESISDEKRCEYLLEKMNNTEHRGAKFVCTIVCAFPGGETLTATGECPGEIAEEPSGSDGFGYDPVFIAEGCDRTFAEMSQEEKNAVSHRGAALREFSKLMRENRRKKTSKPVKRVGIYGGTFNPPHLGHEKSANTAARLLELDLLIIVPAGNPPHKAIPDGSPSAGNRFHMISSAFGNTRNVLVSDFEINKDEPNYSIDTVSAIQREYPDAELFLLVGTDMYLSLESWMDSEALLKTVTPAVFSRGPGEKKLIENYSRGLKMRYNTDTKVIDNSIIEISSSRLRDMLPGREGTRYIADTIYSYIIKHRLYGAKPEWNWLREKAYQMLSHARIPHVAGCEEEALRLAERWGSDLDDAREAAILHDITKKLDIEGHLSILKDNGVDAGNIIPEEEKLLHSKTGAVLARARFGVSDEVYGAIMWHTTGRAQMSVLEKVIYLADYIEPVRDFDGVGELRALAYKDLDEAMIAGLEMSVADMKARGITPNRMTFDALNDLKAR